MTHGKSDAEIIQTTHNLSRYFTENRHIAWVLLIATILWGVYGYHKMPQRKDPDIPIRQALAIVPWPGAGAERVEQLITRRVDEKITENASVDKVESISKTGLSIVYVTLVESIAETGKVFDDIKLKLDTLTDLPEGAGPIQFFKDFGDTAALMLTVASPRADEVEIALRAQQIRRAIEQARASAIDKKNRASLVVAFPATMNPALIIRESRLFGQNTVEAGLMRDLRTFHGPGFIGMDGATDADDQSILGYLEAFIREKLCLSEFHPDIWNPFIIRSLDEVESRLSKEAGDKYTYRDLEKFTDLIRRTIQTVPLVSKVNRAGVLKENVYLEYSQQRLASYGIKTSAINDALKSRNITLPGGMLEIGSKNVRIDPSGEFKSEKDIGSVIVTTTETGTPLYLRDLVDIYRDYENPATYLNFFTWKDGKGVWQRTRAITLAVQMRPGEQIEQFGDAVRSAIDGLRTSLPPDLILAHTSDQQVQVRTSVDLFMRSLYEAIVLIVIVALIGFREWRSATLMAASIPLTLAMTFGMMHILGIDIQQVSIASLIIALGLLVDDPVVAGDAIKRELSAGHPPAIASWLGPTKLATAILFATITNIVTYLPFLTLTGDTGRFLYSFPIVLACSLIASRIVSMTFIPHLGYTLLRPGKKPDPTVEERRGKGLAGAYYRAGSWALDHRYTVVLLSLVFVALGALIFSLLRVQFFPKDLSTLSYVDVWLPEDATLFATGETTLEVEEIIKQVAEEYGHAHRDKEGRPKAILRSITTFVGGGGPRFWFSVSPEREQLNYAQVIIEVFDSHDTATLVDRLQTRLSADLAGAMIDVRQLESGSVVGIPIQIRLSGEDIRTLKTLAGDLKDLLRSNPLADRVRDDWGDESFSVKLQVNADRANLAGLSNIDVAASSAAGVSGRQVTVLREGADQIPVVTRFRMEERAQLADLQNLYVDSMQGTRKVPLRQVSSVGYSTEMEKMRRRNQFRTITVQAFPIPGALPSELLDAAEARIKAFQAELPPGYKMEIGGEQEEQSKGFTSLAIAMAISVASIFLALVFQFKNVVKPLIVFAVTPSGVVGSLIALWVMGTAFDFMAFLGIASLIGVIVSHIIVLFDFIEEMHAHGKPFKESVLDAGIARLRPVFITVGATVLGLVPLAMHGGPLWEPLCYAQIGGLLFANFITKLLVPAVYAICVLDLKIVPWEGLAEGQSVMS